MPNRQDIPGGGLDQQQLNNASLIIRIGRQLGFDSRDIRTALMVAMQESSLRNLDSGDRDSAGLFQQRPSQGWGTYDQVTDPHYAINKFYSALRGVHGRAGMKLWQAGQAVQRSADGTLYADWAPLATDLLRAHPGSSSGQGPAVDGWANTASDMSAYTSVGSAATAGQSAIETLLNPAKTTSPQTPTAPIDLQPMAAVDVTKTPGIEAASAPMDPAQVFQSVAIPSLLDHAAKSGVSLTGGDLTGWRQKVVGLAHKFLGTPYVWGGASPGGFDCSGLIQYVFGQAGIKVPRITYDQQNLGTPESVNKLKPGDLVMWDNNPRMPGMDHVALYIGGGKIIEAPRPGLSVQVSSLYDLGEAQGIHLSY